MGGPEGLGVKRADSVELEFVGVVGVHGQPRCLKNTTEVGGRATQFHMTERVGHCVFVRCACSYTFISCGIPSGP